MSRDRETDNATHNGGAHLSGLSTAVKRRCSGGEERRQLIRRARAHTQYAPQEHRRSRDTRKNNNPGRASFATIHQARSQVIKAKGVLPPARHGENTHDKYARRTYKLRGGKGTRVQGTQAADRHVRSTAEYKERDANGMYQTTMLASRRNRYLRRSGGPQKEKEKP